jgi:NAD(P)-dependent dehydrogenase (short-subunit alcohol dehydrogenase family)
MTKPHHQLANKVLVVVGGSTGLGLSAARTFAREGARLVIVGRNRTSLAKAQRELGRACIAISGDASDPKTANRAVAQALKTFGAFHGLYHVAGGSGRKAGDGPLDQLTDDGWHYTLAVNLNSMFYSNRAAAQMLLKQKIGGAILNIGSVLGSSPSPHFFTTHAYAAAKSAVIGFTRACASYYAPQNIRFNVLAPSLVATPMSQRAQEDPAILEFMKTKQPLDGGRMGQPEDLDAAALFFMSDASKFVTGQVLAVDGGWSVSEGQH